MKLRKEYLVLAGIIAVLLIALALSGGRNKMRYRVPVLDRLESDAVTRMEISRSGESVLLEKKQGQWTLEPQGYKADPDKISGLLEVITGLTLTELAAEKKDDLRYELDDENKINVKAYEGENLVREFDVGKVSPTYRHTFVRISQDTRIFHARDSFRNTFDVAGSELRQKSVLSFDKNEITQAFLSQKEISFRLTKQIRPPESPVAIPEEEGMAEPAEPEEVWLTEDGSEAKKTEMDSILSQLSVLDCDEFIEDKTKEDFTEPVYSLVLTGSKDFSLQIFAKNEEADKYPALSSETPYPFFLSTWKAENIMKDLEEFLEEKKEVQ